MCVFKLLIYKKADLLLQKLTLADVHYKFSFIFQKQCFWKGLFSAPIVGLLNEIQIHILHILQKKN